MTERCRVNPGNSAYLPREDWDEMWYHGLTIVNDPDLAIVEDDRGCVHVVAADRVELLEE